MYERSANLVGSAATESQKLYLTWRAGVSCNLLLPP